VSSLYDIMVNKEGVIKEIKPLNFRDEFEYYTYLDDNITLGVWSLAFRLMFKWKDRELVADRVYEDADKNYRLFTEKHSWIAVGQQLEIITGLQRIEGQPNFEIIPGRFFK